MESDLPACSVCMSETKISDIDVKRYTFRALFTSIECVGGENDITYDSQEKNMVGNKCLKAGEFKIAFGSYRSTKLESYVHSKRMFPSARYLICNVCNKISKPTYSYDDERNFVHDHVIHIYSRILANWWEHKRTGKELEVNPSTMQLPHSNSAMNILFVRKKDVESAALDARFGNGPLNGDVFKENIKKARPRIMAHSGLKYSKTVSARIGDTLWDITRDVTFEYGALMLAFKKDASSSTCCIICETSYDSHFPDPETIYGHFKECLIGHKEALSLNTFDSLSEMVGEKITVTARHG